MSKTSKQKGNLIPDLVPAQLLEAVDDGVSVVDREMRVVYANQAHRNVFGQDLIGKECCEVLDIDDCSTCPVTQCFLTGEPESGQQIIGEVGRSGIFIDIKASPLRNDEGEIVAAVVLSRDITERKLIEQEADRRSREIVALAEVAMALNQSIELKAVFEIAIRSAANACGATSGAIRLFDEESNNLVLKALYPKQDISALREDIVLQPLADSVAGRATQVDKIIFIHDIED
ncbi:MAG TPA: PAS domain-containing protein, partial [Actinobacteria bacterium]|nr:PAS domain-containing protein [Actinomycetota bacterium]